MLSNFLFHVGQYLRENRRQIVKALLIAAAAMFVVALIYYGVERLQRARYEKRVQALESQFRAADTKAKEVEAKAKELARAIEAKQAELHELALRASAAEAALSATRRAIVPLKETYEEARNNPVIAADISCADVCARLAELGHPCR